LTCGCTGQEDKLVGSWELNNDKIYVVLTLHSDKTFTSKLEISKLGDMIIKKGSVSGEWDVKDGYLVTEIKVSNLKGIEPNTKSSDKIIEIKDNKLVLQNQSGNKEVYKKISR
jgi:hypothetical protein